METRWHGSRSGTAMVYQPTLLPQAREEAGRACRPDWVITFSDGIIYLHDAGLRSISYLLTWARPHLRPKNKRVGQRVRRRRDRRRNEGRSGGQTSGLIGFAKPAATLVVAGDKRGARRSTPAAIAESCLWH